MVYAFTQMSMENAALHLNGSPDEPRGNLLARSAHS
jgi:hypothetical protein